MYFKIYGVTLFCPNTRSRSPQMSPCHNRTQITLKSKQEFPGLVNFFFFSVYFPLLSSKDDVCLTLGGDSHMKGAGMLGGNYELKETTLGVAQFFFYP